MTQLPFAVHDVLRMPGEPVERHRVLWISVPDDAIVTIEVTDHNAWPRRQALADVLSDEKDGALIVEPFKEYRDYRVDTELKKEARHARDAAWRIVHDFVANMPACFDKRARTKFVAAAMVDHGISRPTVVRMLQAYWRRGMNPNAVLPLYEARGGKGKPRNFSGVRLGRPRDPTPEGMETPPPGMDVKQDERRFFALAIDREYAENRKLSLRAAYDRCIAMFFADRVPDPDRPGRMKFVPRAGFADTGMPTFGQFKYWVDKDRDLTATARKRETPRVYDLKNRALGGTPSSQAWGPGSRYEIDATIADVYLRSRLDRNQLIGRPVIYVVIDVFSRLIVGVYVGLEGPSWAAAMMALANAVANKKDYCASIGIDIDESDWPARHLPAFLLGDRGELEGNGIAQTLKLFHVTCENAAAWRPDWKGIVESRFRILQQGFKAYTPGYVDTDFRARGTRDYRGDAVLTLDEFERIIVNLILYFNNDHELKTFDRHAGMVEDRVRSIPRDMWNWGIPSVGGLPKAPASERVRYGLMPRHSASITDRGIKFQGRFYESPRSRKWSQKIRTKGERETIEIGFDKRNVDEIYLADPKAEFGFEVARLTKRSREAGGGSGWEAEGLHLTAKAMSKAGEQQEQMKRLETIARNEDEIAKAAAEADAVASSAGPLARQTKGARENRALEKEARGKEESQRFSPAQKKSADIHYLPSPAERSGPAAKPSYDSLREGLD